MRRIFSLISLIFAALFFSVASEAFAEAPQNAESLQESQLELANGKNETVLSSLDIGEGMKLTAYHAAKAYEMKLLEIFDTKVLIASPQNDLAILGNSKCEKMEDAPNLKLAAVEKNEKVYVLGGGEWICGFVLKSDSDCIYAVIHCEQGFSGKAVYNSKGELVGIMSKLIRSRDYGDLPVAMVVPAQKIRDLLYARK